MASSPLEDENAPLYTVGQVAELLAVKQAFLRRVDTLQVVSPQRSAGLAETPQRSAGADAYRRPHTKWAEGRDVMASSPLEDENAPLYTVGQVAEMLAVKHAFLRRVDALQVVSPQRSAGGQRRYTRYEIHIIQEVMTMADEGITLQAIRRIISLERQLAAVTRERDELARRLAAQR